MSDTTSVTSDVKLCATCGATFGEDDDKRFNECATCRVGTPSVPVVDESGVEPLHIDIPEGAVAPPPERAYYWCGVTADSPWGLITLGGINFQKTVGEVVPVGDKMVCRDDVAEGVIHHLTDAQVAVVLEHAKNKSVRNFRKAEVRDLMGSHINTTGDRIDHKGSGARPYVPQQGDIPIGCFVYIVKVRHKKDRPLENPPTLVERNF
jgi:hypothetical protein